MIQRLWPSALVITALLGGPCLAAATVDDVGRTVELAAPAERIVTLAPHATELAVAAGLADRLVAVAAGGPMAGDLAGLPRIGGPGALDREALLALRPDLVIGWQSGNRPGDLDWIQRNGIALYRSEPRTLRHIAASIRALGRLGGTVQMAESAAARFEQATQTRCAGLPPLTVYVEVWDRPAMSLGGRHWLNAALRAAGLRGAFAELPLGAFPVAEEVRRAHRDRPTVSLLPATGDRDNDRLAGLLSRPGPALAEAIQRLCQRRLDGGWQARASAGQARQHSP